MLMVRILKETKCCDSRVQAQSYRLLNINDVRTESVEELFAEAETEEQQKLENKKHRTIYAEQDSDANVYPMHEH